MPGVNNNIINAEDRHSIFLQSVYSGMSNHFEKYIKLAEKAIRKNLLKYDELTDRKKLVEVITNNIRDLDKIYSDWNNEQLDLVNELSDHEVEFLLELYNKEVAKVAREETGKTMNSPETKAVAEEIGIFEEPSNKGIYAAILAVPLLLDRKALTVKQMQRGFLRGEIKRVNDVIENNFKIAKTTGEVITTALIMQQIRGTKANQFKDGVLNTTNNNSRTITKTIANHGAAMAAQGFQKKNGSLIIGYQLKATLDGSTTDICRGLHGNIYLYSDKVRIFPPFHWGCRTITVSVFKKGSKLITNNIIVKGNKPTSKKETYYGWLKGQPVEVQDMALGKTKAEIFREAGMEPKEFRQLITDRFNRPLTIQQLRKKNSEIFKLFDEGK